MNLQTSSHKVNIHDVNDIMDNILIELDDIILREGNTNTPTEKIGKSGWKLHRYFNLTVDVCRLEHYGHQATYQHQKQIVMLNVDL